MRIRYTESFPHTAPDNEVTLRLIHAIVDERLAAELLKRLAREQAWEARRDLA